MLQADVTSVSSPHLTLNILLFALVSASSPLALGTVLVVLTHGRARVNGAAFAIGFIAGQAVFWFIAFSLDAASFHVRGKHPTLIASLEIAFGVALLATAVYVRRQPAEPARVRPPNTRIEAMRARLARLSPGSALGVGAALGIGGPKRITITIVATAAITAAGLSEAGQLGLAILYVAIATSLVWVPVTLYILWGPRAAGWLTSGERWIGQHKKPLTFWPSAVLGLGLVADGLVQLIS